MDPGVRSPLIDFFRRGEVTREVRLLAAQGAFAPRAQEQLALLVLLADDADPEIAPAAEGTLWSLPVEPLRGFLARSDVTSEMRGFFAARGIEPAQIASTDSETPLVDTLAETPAAPESTDADGETKLLSSLPVLDRIKLAMKGTREQRSTLIR